MTFFKRIFNREGGSYRKDSAQKIEGVIELTEEDILPLDDEPIKNRPIDRETLQQKNERELENFSKHLFAVAEKLEPGLATHCVQNIQSWKRILKTEGEKLSNIFNLLAHAELPVSAKEFWAKKLANPKTIDTALLDVPAWEKIITSLFPLPTQYQHRALELMIGEASKEGGFTYVLERLNRNKSFIPEWAKHFQTFEDFVEHTYQTHLKRLDLTVIDENIVRDRWAPEGNTYATFMYNQPHEAVISFERKKREAFLQIAIYFDKGVRVGELTEVFVQPELRGTALLGPKLIQLAEKILLDSGVEKGIIKAVNHDFVPLLERKGFFLTGTDGTGRTLTYEKDLDTRNQNLPTHQSHN